MSESYIQDLFAERIGGAGYGKDTAIYKFEKIKRAKRAAAAAHPNVESLDLGVHCLLVGPAATGESLSRERDLDLAVAR